MTEQLKSIGLRPGTFASYDTGSLIKFFAGVVLVVLILTWVAFEIFDYIPESKSGFQEPELELFQSSPIETDIYYKPVPRPANNIEHPDGNSIDAPIYDNSILRANRYYNTTDGLSREIPVTNLLSLTNEMPTTYMISLLEKIKTTDATFSFPVTNTVSGFINYYVQGPNDYKKKPSRFVLSNLDKLTPTDLVEVAELAELFAICRLWLITKINMTVLDDKMADPNHPFSQFEVINSRNTKILITNPDDITAGLTLICDMMIHRPYKTHTFNIQTTINAIPSTDKKTVNCTIKDIRLIGSTIDGEAPLPESITPSPFNGVSASSAPVSKRNPASSIIPNAVDIAVGDYSAGSVELEKNMAEYMARQEFNKDKKCGDIDTRNRLYESSRAEQSTGDHAVTGGGVPMIDENKRRYLELNCGGKCYGVNPLTNAIVELFKYDDNKIACESTHNELDGKVGVYDYPCKQDTDCPYWQANKNYPNTFGKCIKSTGVCEMPEGVVRMGFTKQHEAGKAKCNNCSKLPGYNVSTASDEACCVEQQNNLSTLGILSPDYRFRGDYTVRRQPANITALAKLGLLP